ncbi:AMP-binding protein [Gemmobacter sp. 24YEA27]|uniref:AMP-binding protein n=1 Tax=Gemmobacter sp. 24YEA27 TaxID=3040672 RepID=UPI0032C4117A
MPDAAALPLHPAPGGRRNDGLYRPQPFQPRRTCAARRAATPDKVALAVLSLTGATRWSYARLIASVRGLAGWMLDAGLRPGDRLLLRLGNTPDYPLCYLGAMAAGIVPVATSPLLTGPEITRMAAQVSPKAVIAGEGIACPEGCAA